MTYEVRWTINGKDFEDSFIDSTDAWRLYNTIVESVHVDSIGLYAQNGDGAEKELAVWSR